MIKSERFFLLSDLYSEGPAICLIQIVTNWNRNEPARDSNAEDLLKVYPEVRVTERPGAAEPIR